MVKRTIFATLGLAFLLVMAAPSQAHAGVFVSVNVGPVVPRPAYVVGRPYAYRPVVVGPVFYRPVPVFVRPAPVVFYRGRWCPRPYAYRGYYGPRYWRH